MGDGSPRERGVAQMRSGVRQEVLLDVVAVGLEQHAGTAELSDLLLRPLDHPMALAALGVQDFACGSHLEALFSARLGLQLGHLALLIAAENHAGNGVFAAKMLVRALKVLRFLCRSTKPAQLIATAALIQPGDEGRAYGRTSSFWQR